MDGQLKQYIITGGPGSGKTSLIEELRKRGYRCFDEVSRKLIQEQQATNGDMLPWKDLPAFADLNLMGMIKDYEQANAEICFYDRGIPDIPAYFNFRNLHVDQKVYTAMECFRYETKVFINPPWEEIYVNDPERPESFEDSVEIYNFLKQSYSKQGYQLSEMPKASIAERADYIEKIISL